MRIKNSRFLLNLQGKKFLLVYFLDNLKFHPFFTQNQLKTRIADGRKHQSLIDEKNIFYLLKQ